MGWVWDKSGPSERLARVERCKQKPCCCRLCQSTTCHFKHFHTSHSLKRTSKTRVNSCKRVHIAIKICRYVAGATYRGKWPRLPQNGNTLSSFCCTSQACKEIIEVLSCFFLGWLANLLAFLQWLTAGVASSFPATQERRQRVSATLACSFSACYHNKTALYFEIFPFVRH